MDTLGSAPLNDWLGPRRVGLYLPTADGNYQMSTPSSGARYSTIDEIPPVTTDYNTLAAAGDKDSFVVEDLAGSQTIVNAVVLWIYGKTTDAGVASMKGLARHGGADGFSSVVVGVPGSSQHLQQMPILINPSTGSPFTRAEFNAAEFGYARET